jgi:hypothetical protein
MDVEMGEGADTSLLAFVERGAEYLRNVQAAEDTAAQALASFDAMDEEITEAGHDQLEVTRLAYERVAQACNGGLK